MRVYIIIKLKNFFNYAIVVDNFFKTFFEIDCKILILCRYMYSERRLKKKLRNPLQIKLFFVSLHTERRTQLLTKKLKDYGKGRKNTQTRNS